MTVRQKRGVVGASSLALIGAAILLAAVGFRSTVSATTPLRLQLVADGMDFARLDVPETANPVLRLPPGRTVEIELLNNDPGSEHDLAIVELKVKTRRLKTGESAVLRFTTPRAGTLTYYCTVHPVMMRGQIMIGATVVN